MPDDTAVVKRDVFRAEDIAEFREIFNLIDTDHSGCISSQEMGKLVESVGMKMSKKELQDLVNDVDKDHSGEIDFDEFVATMSGGMNPEYTASAVRNAFQTFARKSPKGLIRMSDLYEALTVYLKRGIDHQEISQLISQFEDSVVYLPGVFDLEGLPVPFFKYEDYISLMMPDRPPTRDKAKK